MPDSNVSSCVLNILGSFSISLGLYKKLKEKRSRVRRPSRKRNERVEGEEELRLCRSLRQGPEDISVEYQNNVYTAGDQFAIGDAIAQTSLAEVLLRLNVGLVGIITSFVNNDADDLQLDYKGLADLSERSRVDTCRALRQLYKRLTHFRPPPPPPPLPKATTPTRDVGFTRTTAKAASTTDLSSSRPKRRTNQGTSNNASRPKIRGPTLAQVVIQDSSKPPQIAMVRPGEKRRKSRSASTSDLSSSSTSKAHPRHDSKMNSPIGTPPPEYSPPQQHQHQHQQRPKAERAKTMPDTRRPHRRTSSSATASSDQLPRTGQTLSDSKSTARLPPPPSREPFDLPAPTKAVPSHSMPTTKAAAASTPVLALPTRRPRNQNPTSFYSIATDSTKLGEIPLHKWTVPYDFDRMSLLNREAEGRGWPNGGEMKGPWGKRRGGFFGLFGRRG